MSLPNHILSQSDLDEVARAFRIFANRYKLADPKLVLDNGKTEICVENRGQTFRFPKTIAELDAYREELGVRRSDIVIIVKEN